jgi:transposase
MELTEEQWEAIRPQFPERELSAPGPQGGRPFQDTRSILDAVLWILRTGAPWADLPRRFPPYQTCHRRYQQWVRDGVMVRILRALAEDLRDRGKLDLTESFIDGTHAGAKRGELWLGSLDVARRPRSWQWRTATVFLSPAGLRVVSEMSRSSSSRRSTLASSSRSQRS